MAAVSHSTLDTTLPAAGNNRAPLASGSAVTGTMLRSALDDHLRAWALGFALLGVGLLAAWAMLVLLGNPGLRFLAAFSAGASLLYIGNLADVQRYRDAIVFIVPALFIWSVLALDPGSAIIIGLALFTHVFLAFVATFSRAGGTLTELRLWPLLLGFNLTLLIYLVVNWLA